MPLFKRSLMNPLSLTNNQFKLFNSNDENKFITTSIKIFIGVIITVLFGALTTWFTWVTHNILLNQVVLNTQSEKYSQLNKQIIQLDGSLFKKELEIDNQISDIKQLTNENLRLIEEIKKTNQEKQEKIDYQLSLLELEYQTGSINDISDNLIEFNNIVNDINKPSSK